MEQPDNRPPYQVRLENYEGPLDLLLDLIRKQQMDIYDIPIAKITGQYLEYLHRDLEKLDTDVAGEFLLMAATLIQIKSKMLLPPDPDAEPEEEDPRTELVQQLLEHEKFRNAAQMLHQKQTVQNAMWSAPALEAFLQPEEEQALAVTIYDLVKAFQQVLDRAKEKPLMAIEGEKTSVADMMRSLCDVLATGRAPVAFEEMFRGLRSREALVTAFLALLELVRLQAVIVRQLELFGEIVLHKHKMFDVVFEDRTKQIDREYQ